MNFSKQAYDIIDSAEAKLVAQFQEINDIALHNQNKVLDAFRKFEVAQRHFGQTNGYGYDDIGRDTLCKLFAEIFGAEQAIVSPLIVSGTHAISLALFGVLRPNDEMVAISGAPYDTLQTIITGENIGSLKDYNIAYKQVELLDGNFDYANIKKAINEKTKLIFIGRSRGYEWRDAISIDQIKDVCAFIRSFNQKVVIMCDNCYGEFIDYFEPTQVGADLVAGSMIKNIGGGIAPTGGYICGKSELIEQVSYKLTAPSIGMEVGSYAYGYRTFYQGLFLAPHTTANAVKGSLLFGRAFADCGFDTMPLPEKKCNDIIRSIKFDNKDDLISFCRCIQQVSPIDSNVTPFPWDMPGYTDQVIMAAGTFIAGASIELSADSPIKEPYVAYLQGGLTYEHCKIAALYCVDKIILKN
ncbi:MAG: aminotransferase class I/II-fold pyridoxal phosphate-dependent enzyme [Clostridia bacterium]